MIHQPVIKKVVSGSVSEGWYPPADWGWDAASALINDGDNGFVALYACYSDFKNFAAFTATFVGTGSVDWGDGSPAESVTSGVKIQHEFIYGSISSSATSYGFKPATIKFICTGVFSIIGLDRTHNPTIYGALANMKYVAIKLRSQYTSEFQYNNYDASSINPHILDFGDSLKVRIAATFSNHRRLKKLIYDFSHNSTTNLSTPLTYCSFQYDWNSINWNNYTSLYTFWSYYFGTGDYKLNISIPSCTTIGGAWQYDSGFTQISLTNTGNVNSIAQAIYDNPNVISFEMDDASSVTSTYLFVRAYGVNNLQHLLLPGLKIGIDLTNQRLSSSEINAFLTALGNANGAQTINLAGNPGALTCDVSIGTAKGYTIITA